VKNGIVEVAMADVKNCPSCGAEVPASATRCKDCFHDFTASKKTSYAGPLLVLASIAGMTFVATIVFAIVAMMPTDQRILVDEGTQSVVITTKYRTSVETERIAFSDIIKVEHVASGGEYQIVVVTDDAERKTIMSSRKEPLYSEAEKYAKVMNKPLERVGEDEKVKSEASPGGL
jgi:hypothetical protein